MPWAVFSPMNFNILVWPGTALLGSVLEAQQFSPDIEYASPQFQTRTAELVLTFYTKPCNIMP